MDDVAGGALAGRAVRDVIADDLVSTTYTAVEPDDDRLVALRVVAEDLCIADGPDAELYERFHRRAAAALTFEHPNAPAVEEVGDDRGRGYLVTAHVEAASLSSWLAGRGAVPLDEALPLFRQVADVLDALHREGLTHGAVNPATLRVAIDGDRAVPFLTGYGIGALLELRLRRDRKQLRVVDDLLYVAPEQLRQQPLTGRTDQYAMACAMLHVLTGSPPYARDTVGGLFGGHLFVEPEVVDEPWSAPLRKGMAKQPRARYATCGQLVDDITYARRRAASRRGLAARRATVGPTVLDLRVGANGAHAHAGGDRNGTATPVTGVGATDDPQTAEGGTATPAPPAGAPANGTATPVARQRSPDGRGPGAVADERAPAGAARTSADDDSATRRPPGAAMSYAAQQEEGTRGDSPAAPPGDLQDVPLLSEVLRHRPQAREPAGWRPPGVLVMLVLIALAAAAVTVWVVST
jgi:hypothetical protein